MPNSRSQVETVLAADNQVLLKCPGLVHSICTSD